MYLHGDDKPGVSSTFNSGIIVTDEEVIVIDLPQYRKFKGYQRALEIAVRRIHRELTVGLP